MAKRALTLATVFAAACTAGVGDDTGSGDDGRGSGGGPGADDPCKTPVAVPISGRAIDLMPPLRLAEFAARMPCVGGGLRATLESTDTLWYDRQSLTPGYQDSFGDNVVTPIGMRPNTIDAQLIDLAVPGGHAQIFSQPGFFHFPFGHPIGPVTNVTVVDFWQPPNGQGAPLPVVYWQRDPNDYTHRVEWMFPVDTLFGELLLIDDGDQLRPFEIRTRKRTAGGWEVDVYRPFPSAIDLADAIEARRIARPEWANSPALAALVDQLRDPSSLAPLRVSASHFPGAFPSREGGLDALPTLTGSDAELIHELLVTTPFRSARGIAWKSGGGRTAWAAGAEGSGSIVPAGYNAGAIEVSEASCDGCHRDAGRPFKTWYDNILAYGELWGNDEIFTWHPFTLARFVDRNGDVVNFNNDNREIRRDLRDAGLIELYDPTHHPAARYQRIIREWTDFRY